METDKYKFPKIAGIDSVKIPRDFNKLATMVDVVLDQELTRVDGDVTQLEQTVISLNDQIAVARSEMIVPERISDLSVSQINKNKGKIDQSFLTTDLLNQIAGTAPVNVMPNPDSITVSELSEKAVTPYKADFFDSSSNLFDKTSVIPNTSFDATTGQPVSNATTSATDFIAISPNAQYTGSNIARRVFYDASKAFISTSTVDEGFTAPANARFIRLSIFNTSLNTAQLNRGGTLLAYESFYNTVKEKHVIIRESLATPAIFYGNIPVVFNLITNAVTIGAGGGVLVRNLRYLLPTSTVALIADATQQVLFYNPKTSTYTVRKTSDLTTGDVISKDNIGLAIIDRTNKRVYAIGNYTVTTDDFDVYDKRVQFASVPVPTNYTTPATGLQTTGTGTDGFKENGAPFTPYQSVYDKYDELMAANPSYITKTLLGKDSSGTYDIYKYEFLPQKPIQPVIGRALPKMILTTNLHGHEKISVYSLYWLMKGVCQNWRDDATLEYLRWNVHFIIIPLVNPWGFVNNTRLNANAVDLNRNFDYKWAEYVPGGASEAKGPSVFSEAESQYIRDVLLANKDAIYYADFHTNAGDPNSYNNLFWHVGTDDATIGLARHIIGDMTRRWQKEFTDAERAINYYGYSSKSEAPYATNYARKVLGILAATPELFQRAPGMTENGHTINRINHEFMVRGILNVLEHVKDKCK